MTKIYKYSGRTININEAWADDNGIRHPANWNIWSAEEKKERGITEVTLQDFPSSVLYTSTHNDDGSVNSVDKDLNGAKDNLKNACKSVVFNKLSISDWAYIRKIDKGTGVPSAIQTFRDAVRTSAASKETAIDNAADISALETLINDGTLNNWPE